jgi:energy-coupling factor transporter ATPase
MNHFIEIRDLNFSYLIQGQTSLPALRGISLSIEKGDYLAVIGANGCGKTTLVRHLNALLTPSSGSVLIDGLDTRDPANYPQIRSKVGMVFQSPEDQLVATLVEDDVAFGLENMGLPPGEIRQRVNDALIAVGLWEHRSRPPHLLSAGQMQRVALAGVMAMSPGCIVLDEATAMLDPAGRRAVLEIIDKLHQQGVTIILVTHFMEEVVRAGRVVVLNQGRLAIDGTPAEIFSHPSDLMSLGLGLPAAIRAANILRRQIPTLDNKIMTPEELIAGIPSPPKKLNNARENSLITNSVDTGGPFISVDQLSHIYLKDTPLQYQALDQISLRVAEHEFHSLAGATGSGKSTLMQHINGLYRPQQGSVKVGPFDLNSPEVDIKAVRRFAGLVFQLPEMQLFEQYVGDEIAYGPRLMGIDGNLRENVHWAMEIVGLNFERYKDRLTFTLSGGEKRKVALASILAIKPQVLLLDEPTAGLDPVSRIDLIQNLKLMQSEGLTLIFSTHQMELIVELAERATVVNAGKDVINGRVDQVLFQIEKLLSLGLDIPVSVRVIDRLRAQGWPLPEGIASFADLEKAITQLTEARAG